MSHRVSHNLTINIDVNISVGTTSTYLKIMLWCQTILFSLIIILVSKFRKRFSILDDHHYGGRPPLRFNEILKKFCKPSLARWFLYIKVIFDSKYHFELPSFSFLPLPCPTLDFEDENPVLSSKENKSFQSC